MLQPIAKLDTSSAGFKQIHSFKIGVKKESTQGDLSALYSLPGLTPSTRPAFARRSEPLATTSSKAPKLQAVEHRSYAPRPARAANAADPMRGLAQQFEGRDRPRGPRNDTQQLDRRNRPQTSRYDKHSHRFSNPNTSHQWPDEQRVADEFQPLPASFHTRQAWPSGSESSEACFDPEGRSPSPPRDLTPSPRFAAVDMFYDQDPLFTLTRSEAVYCHVAQHSMRRTVPPDYVPSNSRSGPELHHDGRHSLQSEGWLLHPDPAWM